MVLALTTYVLCLVLIVECKLYSGNTLFRHTGTFLALGPGPPAVGCDMTPQLSD